MIVLASVDLPEPFGPISAWVSPLPTFEVDAVEDLELLRADVQVLDLQAHAGVFFLCGFGAVRLGPARSERDVFEGADDGALDAGPQELRGAGSLGRGLAGADGVAIPSTPAVMHSIGAMCPRAPHHLGHVMCPPGARQRVAAVRRARLVDELGAAKALHQVLEIGERQALRLGDGAERDGLAPVMVGERWP